MPRPRTASRILRGALLTIASFAAGYLLAISANFGSAGREAVSAPPRRVESVKTADPVEQSAVDELTLATLLTEFHNEGQRAWRENAIMGLAESELRRLIEEIESSGRKTIEEQQLRFQLYRRWGEVAPHVALEYSQPLPELDRSRIRNQILSGWAQSDALGAWNWALLIDDESLSTITGGNPPGKNVHLSAIAQRMVELGKFPELVAALKSTPDEPGMRMRYEALYVVMRDLVRYDHNRAVEVIYSFPESSQSWINSLLGLSRALAMTDPEGTAALVTQQFQGVTRESLLRSVFWEWASGDERDNARRWILAQPPSRDVDAALTGYLRRRNDVTPAEREGVLQELRAISP